MESLRQSSAVREIDPISPTEYSPATPIKTPLSRTPSRLGPWVLLWGRRTLLYKAAVYGAVVSALIAFLIPREFESTVSIMPPDPTSGSSAMLAALVGKTSPSLATMAGSFLGVRSSGDLFVDLLRSRTVQDDLVDRFSLQKVYWSRYKQDARKRLNKKTEVYQDRKSGVISVVVTDSSPQRAHDLAQAYIEELNRLVAQVSTSSARRERIFIEQRLASVKADLEDAEQRFSAFASKNTALDIKEQTKAMVESAALLQGQMMAAQSELEGLQQIYTPNNVRVRAAQARIAELKRQLQKIGGSDASLSSDSGKSDELYPSIRKLPLLGVEWADLYRRLKIQETVFELLNQQYELARIQEAKEIATVNVIDTANVPEKKSFPPRLLITAILTLVSVAGAGAWIVYSERITNLSANDPRRVVFEHAADTLRRIATKGKGFWERSGTTRNPAATDL